MVNSITSDLIVLIKKIDKRNINRLDKNVNKIIVSVDNISEKEAIQLIKKLHELRKTIKKLEFDLTYTNNKSEKGILIILLYLDKLNNKYNKTKQINFDKIFSNSFFNFPKIIDYNQLDNTIKYIKNGGNIDRIKINMIIDKNYSSFSLSLLNTKTKNYNEIEKDKYYNKYLKYKKKYLWNCNS